MTRVAIPALLLGLVACASLRGPERLPIAAPFVAVPRGERPSCKENDPSEACRREWRLFHLHERSFADVPHNEGNGAYRVVYDTAARCFAPTRIARVEWRDGRGVVTRKELGITLAQCGAKAGSVCIAERSRPISPEEWHRVDSCFRAEGFFQLSTVDPLWEELIARKNVWHTMFWTVEGASAGKWSEIRRAYPWVDVAKRHNESIWRCGALLIELAGEDIHDTYGVD